MAKIIKQHGFDAKCEHCGCEFEYEKDDFRKEPYGNPEQYQYDILVKCPNCGGDVHHNWHHLHNYD